MYKKLSGVWIMAYTEIDDPSVYFQTTLYTGNGGALNIVNGGNSDLQPDWVWLKDRTATNSHRIVDSSRGVQKAIRSNATNAEGTDTGLVTAFNSDGFSHNSTDTAWNGDGDTYVAWQWKANGGTRTTFAESGNNPAGGYQANTTAGFSIVDYTGTGATGTIAHGLGAKPEVILVKGRDDGHAWIVGHTNSGAGFDVLVLNATDAASNGASEFNDTVPTSSVFTVKSAGGTNKDGEKYIAYCFAEKQGFSRFGNYIGNGTTDGGFVYTGFKPAWLMVKEIVSGGGWGMWDNKRMPFNTSAAIRLLANTNAADDTSNDNRIDFLSNGFKVRTSSGGFNQNATTYIYLAFAESPFVSSTGTPTTAR